MSQVFKNGARTELDVGISAATTQFTVIDGTIFPEANASVTGGAINQTSGDWFKLVLQDDEGNFEVVYCYGHESMTHTFTVLRGQEGTTALDFLVGTTVGLRLLSSDMDNIHSTLTLLAETKQEKTEPAAKADALTNPRTITLSGAVQANATWDASGALELVTNNIDVSKANGGTLVVARGGTGATSHTAGQVLVGNGSNAVTSLAIDTTTSGTPASGLLITSGAVNAGLALKANLDSPALTGTPTAPTAVVGANTDQLANTAFVTTAVSNAVSTLLGSAPAAALDTLKELGDALGNDPDFAATMTNALSAKVDKVTGKGLSTNDFTTALLNKLNGVADGANNFSLPTGTNGQVLKHNGSIWVAGTDLNTTYSAATTSANGLMSASDKTKLDGIATGSTKNATDAALRDRTTHTGTQAISTVSGLQAALDSKETPAGALARIRSFGLGQIRFGDVAYGSPKILPIEIGNSSPTQFITAEGGDPQVDAHAPESGQAFSGLSISRGLRPVQFGVSGAGGSAKFWFRGYSGPGSVLADWKRLADLDSPTFTGTVTVPDNTFDLTKLKYLTRASKSGLTTGATWISHAEDPLQSEVVGANVTSVLLSNTGSFFARRNGALTWSLTYDGGLQLNGPGLKLSNSVLSSDANTLDYYEEGSFTPTLYGKTTAGTNTYTVNAGRYTRIGNRVFWEVRLQLATSSGMTGQLSMAGLPFNVANNLNARGAVTIGYYAGFADTAAYDFRAFHNYNAASVDILKRSVGMTVSGAFPAQEVLGTAQLYLSGHYSVS